MKAETVQAGVAQVQQAQTQALSDALGAAYDAGATDQKGLDGSFTQMDIDRAVADAQGVDAAAFQAAQDKSTKALADIQAKVDALAAKEGQEASVIAGFQKSVTGLQAALAALSALIPTPTDDGSSNS
jgi:hypothetical protein